MENNKINESGHQVLLPSEVEELVNNFNLKYAGITIALQLDNTLLPIGPSQGKFKLESIKYFDYQQVQGSGFQKFRYGIYAVGSFKKNGWFTSEERLYFGVDPTNNHVARYNKNMENLKNYISFIFNVGRSVEFGNEFCDIYNVANGKRPKNENGKWSLE